MASAVGGLVTGAMLAPRKGPGFSLEHHRKVQKERPGGMHVAEQWEEHSKLSEQLQ